MTPSCLLASLMSVVLPAPEGPEMMNSFPSDRKLLAILPLFANPLDLGFQVYNNGSDVRGARLRAHRVDLARHLLAHEIELLAGRLIARDRLLHLLDVMRQSGELFGD